MWFQILKSFPITAKKWKRSIGNNLKIKILNFALNCDFDLKCKTQAAPDFEKYTRD